MPYHLWCVLLRNMNYVQITFAAADETLREVLVAYLAEQGFESFEEDSNGLQAYIQQDKYDRTLLGELEDELGVIGIAAIIEQQNWNEEWEKGFSPVTVDGFCTIRATFHEPDESVEHDIIITPKMSFGTGHHATTQLMVQQMREIDFAGKAVLDFGSGTGVLAILAQKLGATDITAIDNDEWSYENTIENMGYNDTEDIEVLKGSLEVVAGKKYDIILANINRHILIQYMADMKGTLNPGGTIIMSGILDEDEKIVTSEARKAGLEPVAKTQLDNWICLSFQ